MDDPLLRALSAITVSGRTYRFHSNRGEPKVTTDEATKVISYLEDPVATGLWRLSAKWVQAGGLSNELWNEVMREIEGKDTIQIKAGRRDRKIKVTEEWKDSVRTQIFSRISFLMRLFHFLAQQASGQPESQELDDLAPDEEQLVLDLIDTGVVATKYADALAFFQSQLWHTKFSPSTKQDAITRLNSGPFILLKGPREGQELILISWTREPLAAMQTFLQMLGKVQSPELMPVFSPEEEVFAPYFDLLKMVLEHLVLQEHLRPLVAKALTNFSDKNFTETVSAVGLAAEDLLTQVFETLFRQQLTKGLTLGQLVDEVNTRSASLFVRKEEPAPDLTPIYDEIRSAIEAPESQTQVLGIVRRLLAQVIDSNKYLVGRIDRIGRAERRYSVFPERVAHLLTELIRFRNAASHRSRVPIGPYECRRAAFGFVVLLRWWEREKRAIDWTKSASAIVVDSVQRGSGHRPDA